ncbi:MAG: helix-turn-helix domain-containing protein [Dehalococcoidales bacterium]|nr:helix-turn-helix domain-containing protein [Dehalococcoidales bacterium]
MEAKVYTILEFSKAMKVSQSKVYLMARTGEIKSIKLGDRVLIPAWVVDELVGKIGAGSTG